MKGTGMNTPRIDIIAQNGGDGEHYKYEEVAQQIVYTINNYLDPYKVVPDRCKTIVTKILVENFPSE